MDSLTNDIVKTAKKNLLKDQFKEGLSNFNFDAVFNQDKTSSAEQTVKGFINGYLKGGLKSGLGDAAGVAGDLMSGIGDRYAKYSNDEFTDNQKMVQAGIRQVASAFGPIGQAAAAASGAIDAIGKMTGTNLSNIDKTQAQRAGISGSQ
jgi:phosphomevalonate kinase